MPPLRYFASFFCLHHLRHEAAHRLCGFVLLLPCCVSVGSQGESRIVVSQHAADGFDVYSVLKRQGCEGVSEIMEANVWQSRICQRRDKNDVNRRSENDRNAEIVSPR